MEELTLPVVEIFAESSTRVQEIKKQPVFKCEICDTSFKGAFELKPHIESVHGLKVAFRCGNCDITFDTGASLTNHIKTVHEEKNSDKWLKDQIGKEKKEIKSLKCLLCDKTFSKSHHLKVHTESVHEGIKVICPICGIATSSKDGLKKHHRTVHLGIKRKDNNRKSMCPICAKILSTGCGSHFRNPTPFSILKEI